MSPSGLRFPSTHAQTVEATAAIDSYWARWDGRTNLLEAAMTKALAIGTVARASAGVLVALALTAGLALAMGMDLHRSFGQTVDAREASAQRVRRGVVTMEGLRPASVPVSQSPVQAGGASPALAAQPTPAAAVAN